MQMTASQLKSWAIVCMHDAMLMLHAHAIACSRATKLVSCQMQALLWCATEAQPASLRGGGGAACGKLHAAIGDRLSCILQLSNSQAGTHSKGSPVRTSHTPGNLIHKGYLSGLAIRLGTSWARVTCETPGKLIQRVTCEQQPYAWQPHSHRSPVRTSHMPSNLI